MIAKIFKFILIILGIALLAALVYYTYIVIDARNNTEQIVEEAFEKYGREITLDDLSDEQLNILLTVEDPKFFEHNGMDISTEGAGITTISQALVKYLYFEKFKQGIAKIRQTLIAVFALNDIVSKEDQLELFLNSARLGTAGDKSLYGFQMASEHFFGKTFNEITNDEFTELVARLILPAAYMKEENSHLLEQRIKRIQNLLDGKCEPLNNGDVFYEECD